MLPKVGTTLGEKYALEAIIGRGGMGAVYRAKNVLTGRRVALKWILPTLNGADEMRARLLREARAMGRIEHPNVCAVYDVGQDGEAIYLVMELLAGRTLRSMMEERRLEVSEVCRILISAMQGVSAAHRAGVVHRDLKPDNLFVCFDEDGTQGTTKVLDFGVSKILDLSESDGLTKSGMAVGTPHYMSPEQIIGAKNVDERSDVYALGTILYQAIAGRLPFEADNYSALVVQIATGMPEPLASHASEEGAKLAPIVHRAIARLPADRYPDVAEMARALEPFAGGSRFETPRPRPRSEPPPPTSSEIEVALAGATGAVESRPTRDEGLRRAEAGDSRARRLPTAPTLAAAPEPDLLLGDVSATPTPSPHVPEGARVSSDAPRREDAASKGPASEGPVSEGPASEGPASRGSAWGLGAAALALLTLGGLGAWTWSSASTPAVLDVGSADTSRGTAPGSTTIAPHGSTRAPISSSSMSLTTGSLAAPPVTVPATTGTTTSVGTTTDMSSERTSTEGTPTHGTAAPAAEARRDVGRGPRHHASDTESEPASTERTRGDDATLDTTGAGTMDAATMTMTMTATDPMTATGRSGTISTSDFE